MNITPLAAAVSALMALAGSVAQADEAAPQALPGDPYAHETAAERDARMKWWREAKFGMFIHWGIYAVPAGMHEGEKIGGYGEWIMRNGKISSRDYREFAKRFTAAEYKPQDWVDLAKEAGMRYMVITAKHHDGFALYPTRVSDWNVVDATPHGKDLIGPLAQAARNSGLKFGLYYSQSQDWMHPGGAIYGYDEGKVINEDHRGSYDEYLEKIAVPQTREILTLYQPDVLWWDTPRHMSQQRSQPLAELLKLRPGIIHNNRLGGGYQGDTETPEQYIPPTGFPGRDWETCMTMNKSWGYKSFDDNWKPVEVLITNLVNVASKGGNYLLNVGPDASGRIPPESVDLLKQVGAWMKLNGEAIYGTAASPFRRLPWGRCTVKQDGDDSILYLHVFDWPQSGGIRLPGLQNQVKSAKLLVGGRPFEVEPGEFGPLVRLQGKAPDAVSSTVVVRIAGRPQVKPVAVIEDPDRVIRLSPLDAELHGEALKLGQSDGVEHIQKWQDPDDSVSWELKTLRDGNYTIQLSAAAEKEGAVVRINGLGKFACPVGKTGKLREFKLQKVGEVSLKKGRTYRIRLQAVSDGWTEISLRGLELIPRR